MTYRIAIIDPDPVLSESISLRLSKLIPSSDIRTYSLSQMCSNEEVHILEDVIIYDETATSIASIEKHVKKDVPVSYISLLNRAKPMICRRTGSELAEEIQRTLHKNEMQVTPPESINKVPPYRNCLSMIVSFTSHAERENYLISLSQRMANTVDRKIRLNLMPGVCMPRNAMPDRKEKHITSTGISDLLLRLEMNKMTQEELLNYLRLESDGWFSFGLPDRSDDIICCNTDILTSLLLRLRRLCDTSAEKLFVAVIIEGFPFSALKKLCVYSHELHFLFPSIVTKGDEVCDRELNELTQLLPPGIIRFISTSTRQLS